MRLLDITQDMTQAVAYPGDPELHMEQVQTIGEDSDCNLSAMYTCMHTGTHVDAPLHFIEGGFSVDQYDPEVFVGPCTVVEVRDPIVTGECVNSLFPQKAERILIKGGGVAAFMDSAAEEAAQLPLRLIGTDASSIGFHGSQSRTHRAFLSKGIAVLEGLDLSEVAPGDYFLMALPMKVGGAEGAPARVFLADDYIFWARK